MWAAWLSEPCNLKAAPFTINSEHASRSSQACMHGSCDADRLLCMQVYHQFHDGIGHPFPAEYKRDQKAAAMRSGRITFTGCPE